MILSGNIGRFFRIAALIKVDYASPDKRKIDTF
jgi:hypothetical protein